MKYTYRVARFLKKIAEIESEVENIYTIEDLLRYAQSNLSQRSFEIFKKEVSRVPSKLYWEHSSHFMLADESTPIVDLAIVVLGESTIGQWGGKWSSLASFFKSKNEITGLTNEILNASSLDDLTKYEEEPGWMYRSLKRRLERESAADPDEQDALKYLKELGKKVLDYLNAFEYEVVKEGLRIYKGYQQEQFAYGRWGNPNKTKFYIRFGKYPKSGQSKIKLDDEWKSIIGDTERGISVYEAWPEGDKWNFGIGAGSRWYSAGIDLSFLWPRIKEGDIYLVTGPEVQRVEEFENAWGETERRNVRGTDGEPLLERIDHVYKLKPEQVVWGKGTLGDLFVNPPGLQRDLERYYDEMTNYLEGGEIGWMLAKEFGDSDYDSGKGRTPIEEKLISVMEKIKEESVPNHYKPRYNIDDLNEEEKEFLENLITKIKKVKNRQIVMKGFRPFV